MPSQTLSIFNRLGSLAALTGRIIWGLYALKTRVLAMNSMAMLAHLDQQMAKVHTAYCQYGLMPTVVPRPAGQHGLHARCRPAASAARLAPQLLCVGLRSCSAQNVQTPA